MPAEKGAGQPPQQSYPVGRRLQPLDEHKISSKASGATPAGALTRPHGGKFIHSRTKILCRGDAHPYTFGRPLHEGEGDFIALYKQRLQRATGLKPSKSTNTLPPAWQFSLSWGGASADEEHRVLGRHRDCNTRFIKEYKPRNHIRARIKPHVYTTE